MAAYWAYHEPPMAKLKYDAFISHASEDKAAFVEPLALALQKWGLKIWFDKFSLKVGDSLRDSIEMGLANSRYGVVVFSPSFQAKKWPKAELNGLFARQMQGKKKIILPILHKTTIAKLAKTMPIQADTIALNSANGAESVARSLVEVIRPSLLKLEVKKGLAFEAADSLIDTAKAKHPGYDFAVYSGNRDAPIGPGTVAMVKNAAHRIDIRISDPKLIGKAPGLKLRFEGEGVNKALDLYRTGRPQSWKSGEFKYLEANIPLMPSTLEEGSLLMAGSALIDRPGKQVRLEVNSSPPIVFPLMEMRMTRAGTEEAEAVIESKKVPLAVSMVFSLKGSRGLEITFSTNFRGHIFSQCDKVIKALDGLRSGAALRLVDIENDAVAMDGPCELNQFPDDLFPSDFRSIISLAAQIEKYFSISLNFPDSFADSDLEALSILDCLLNGDNYGTNLNATATIVKLEGEESATQRRLFEGLPVVIFQEPTNYEGFFNLFGKQIPAPAWGMYTEKCVLEDGAARLLEFDQAKAGDEFSVVLIAETPTFVQWRASLEPKAAS
jgi:hypothetical protein